MLADSWRVLTGFAVLALGVTAGFGLSKTGPEPAQIESLTNPAVLDSNWSPGTEDPVSISGIPDPVTRVLQQSGNLGFADLATEAEIPASVVEALVSHGVPIAVPSPREAP